jgi:hypothetical protein
LTCDAKEPTLFGSTASNLIDPPGGDSLSSLDTSTWTFHRNPAPRSSYWEAVIPIFETDHQLTVKVEAGRQGQSEEQRRLISDLQVRYVWYFSMALMKLKPAFNRHIGDQRKLQSMRDEFYPISALLRPFPSFNWRTCGQWELAYRAVSRPDYLFTVGFFGERAHSVLVDRD